MTSVFAFTQAIVRAPGASVVGGLRPDPAIAPTYPGVAREHALYVAALIAAGLAVEVLAPLEAFPDAVFVEDPALVFTQGAILLRAAAPTRRGEAAVLRGALERRFARVTDLPGPGFVDGGDILVTPEKVLIGLSARTDRVGAEALAAALAEFGRASAIVAFPDHCLHLKSGLSLITEDTVLTTAAMAEVAAAAGLRVITLTPGEEAAANALRLHDTVLLPAGFPRAADLVRRQDIHVVELPVAEIGKLQAGLSCMSLRWRDE